MSNSINKSYSILVNSTDSFEDCWQPFFKLFSKYWTDYRGKIFLNTETKDFTYNDLDIISVKNNIDLPRNKITWSQCLIKALELIESDVILYLQEDYFLHDKVDYKLIEKFSELMQNNNIDCIHLTDQATSGPFTPTDNELLWETDQKAPYRISMQAALWKKNILKKYLNKDENAWQFELNGTKRSHKNNDRFLCVNKSIIIKDENEIIPYIFTGIIKGKWNLEAVKLFEKNGIETDFSKRGFHDPSKKISYFHRLKNKINNLLVNMQQ